MQLESDFLAMMVNYHVKWWKRTKDTSLNKKMPQWYKQRCFEEQCRHEDHLVRLANTIIKHREQFI